MSTLYIQESRHEFLKAVSNDEAPTSNLYALNLASHHQFVSLGSAQSKEGRRLFNRQQKTGIKADYPVHHSVSHHVLSFPSSHCTLSPLRSVPLRQSRIVASSEIAPDLNVGGCCMFTFLFQSVVKTSFELNWAVRDRELHRRHGLVVAA